MSDLSASSALGALGAWGAWDVRRSSQVVRYDARGRGWDVRASADENSPPPHVIGARRPFPVWTEADESEVVPEPQRSVSPSLPSLPHSSSSSSSRLSRASSAMRPVRNANELALRKEISDLEIRLDNVQRAFHVQNKLIDGFCRLRVQSVLV